MSSRQLLIVQKELILIDLEERRRYFVSLEQNKDIIQSLIEVFTKQNVALMDDFVAPDVVVDHTLQGLDSFKKFETNFIKGFPDYHETIEDIIAEGEKVWGCIKCTGTHKGEYRGFTPTGKKITIAAVLIWRIVNGKVVERESVIDWLDFYKQLGVIEYKGFPDESISHKK